MSAARERMKSEIVRRRVREMFPMGFTVQDISAVVGRTDKHVRNIIAQEFPNGRPTTHPTQEADK